MLCINALFAFPESYLLDRFLDMELPNQRLPWWLSGKKKKICLQCRRPRLDPWIGKIPWRRKWLPTPVFLPGNTMDRGAWWSTVHGTTKSWTWLIDLTVTTKSKARSMLDLLYLLQITLQKDEIFSYLHC